MTERARQPTSEAEAFFDAEAAAYDASYPAPTAEGHALRSRNAAVRRLLGPGPGAVLDAGMGPGWLAAELGELGWTVSGVDVSAAMIERARRRLPAAEERMHQASIEELPFEDASFDAACAIGVLEFTADRARALSELARVLRPHGAAVLSLPNARSPQVIWSSLVLYPLVRIIKRPLRGRGARAGPLRRPWPGSPRAFSRRLAAVGLHVEEVRHANYQVVPMPLDRLLGSGSARLARWLEERPRVPGAVAGTQIVLRARRSGAGLGGDRQPGGVARHLVPRGAGDEP